jgi:hypothetical protein
MEQYALEITESYLKSAHPPMFHMPMAKLGPDLYQQLEEQFPGFTQRDYELALQEALSKLR